MPLNEAPAFLGDSARDIHLLRGIDTVNLSELLSVSWPTGNPAPHDIEFNTYDRYPQPASGADVVLDFKPVFNFQQNATTYTGFGVTINRTTGAVSVANWPANQAAPANFIVEVSTTQNGANPVPATWKPALIRIHLHRSVSQIWMTPSTLSIRRPQPAGEVDTEYAFCVRAQFDDGVVADITATNHYKARSADVPFFDFRRFVRLPDSLRAGASRQVGIVTTAEWGSRAAQATIHVLEPWATAHDIPQAEFIDGRVGMWDGTLKPEKVPNVLFIGVGYKNDDINTINAITDQIVDEFRTDVRFTPYNYFTDSINYWRMLVPAQTRGISVRSEMFTIQVEGQLVAAPIPKPAPVAPGKVWRIENLLYYAGLPIQADTAFVKPDPDFPDQFDFTNLQQKWAAIMPPNPPPDLPDETMAQWIQMANRTFIDEVDVFPPLSVGDPPAVSEDYDSSGLIVLHPLRSGGFFAAASDDLLAFFAHVSAAPKIGTNQVITLDDTPSNNPDQPNNPEVGNLWGSDRPDRFVFDNRSFVVYLGNLPKTGTEPFFGRSQLLGGLGIMTRPTLLSGGPVKDGGIPVTADQNRNALFLDCPDPAFTEIVDETWSTIAHELGHSFTLGDEYGYDGRLPNATQFYEPNLMAFEAALNAPDDPRIQVGQLKWNWDRIRKAAVIQLPINDLLDGTYRVYVRKGTGFQFLPGDAVRLRVRNPRVNLSASVKTTVEEFQVVSTDPTNLDNPADPLTMTVVIKNSAPIGVDVKPYGPGSIIFESLPAPANIATLAHPYLTLVTPAAARIMEKIGGAMNGTTCDPTDTDLHQAYVQTPALSPEDIEALVPGFPAEELPSLVGAYFGGLQHACGVLHPAGSCIMRTGRKDMSRFCPVCRYILVDMVDPEQHWRIDRDYTNHFYL